MLCHSSIANRNAKWYSHSGKELYTTIKKLNIQLTNDPAIALLGIYPREMQCSHNTLYMKFIAATS